MDKKLDILVGGRVDNTFNAAMAKATAGVDAVNKRVGDAMKLFAIGAFAGRAFDAMTAGLEKMGELQDQLQQGAISLGEAYEQAAVSLARSLPIIGEAFRFGEGIGNLITGAATEAEKKQHQQEAAAQLNKSAAEGKAFSDLLNLQAKLAREAALANMSPEERDRAKVLDATKQRLAGVKELEAGLNPATEGMGKIAGAAIGKAVNSILTIQDQELEKLDDKINEQTNRNAQRLRDLQTQIIIEQHEMAGEGFAADKTRIMADLNRRLASESDPAMQEALKQFADLQLEKVDNEIDKAIQESIDGVPFAVESEEPSTPVQRRNAALIQSQFLTGASGSSPIVTEAQKQTRVMNQVSDKLSELITLYGTNTTIAVVKGGLRAR